MIKKNQILGTALVLIYVIVACLSTPPTIGQEPKTESAEWQSLFNGKSLEGWTQKNGWASYHVEDQAIVGTTAQGSPNSFLCTLQSYGDFELEFEVKCDNALNSGVQIRSATREQKDRNEFQFGRVHGPQVEIEASGGKGAEAGYIYGEATGRGWLVPDDQRKPHKHFRDGEWNQYRVLAEGPRVRTYINGELVCDLTDEAIYKTHPRGFVGLQVHGVGNRGPFEVRWRNLRIKELEKE